MEATKIYEETTLIEFLKESNAIEGVYDDQSLTDALQAWNYLMTRDVMTLSVIKETHRILMQHQPILPADKGNFRIEPVFVGGRSCAHWGLIPILILNKFCFQTMRFSPPPDWKELHITYERIHPFIDGNGRTGRMFMNWTRLKRCELPILVIHEGEEQKEYYTWFD